jgi:hypothetical protein
VSAWNRTAVFTSSTKLMPAGRQIALRTKSDSWTYRKRPNDVGSKMLAGPDRRRANARSLWWRWRPQSRSNKHFQFPLSSRPMELRKTFRCGCLGGAACGLTTPVPLLPRRPNSRRHRHSAPLLERHPLRESAARWYPPGTTPGRFSSTTGHLRRDDVKADARARDVGEGAARIIILAVEEGGTTTAVDARRVGLMIVPGDVGVVVAEGRVQVVEGMANNGVNGAGDEVQVVRDIDRAAAAHHSAFSRVFPVAKYSTSLAS